VIGLRRTGRELHAKLFRDVRGQSKDGVVHSIFAEQGTCALLCECVWFKQYGYVEKLTQEPVTCMMCLAALASLWA